MGIFNDVTKQFGKVNPWNWLRRLGDNNVGIYPYPGTPVNGTSGTGANVLGKGAMIVDVTNGVLYMNTNTLASPTWTGIANVGTIALANGDILIGNASNVATPQAVTGPVTISNAGVTSIGANQITAGMLATNTIQYANGTISSANITGTGAGQFGNASGVPLVAAPGAGLAIQIEAVGMYYTFNTAAYTGGGNITVNWGGGGAALTGLIAAASSVGAGANKGIMFVPLSTAGVAIVSNQSINLVSSVAFTQPGTAAGTIAWEVWYRIMNVGF